MTALQPQRIIENSHVLGASEIGVVLGLSPYKSPLELWREKRGELPRFEGNAQTEWGLDVEPALRQWYARKIGQPVYVPPESLFHPTHSWMRATPDGLVLRDGDAKPDDPANWVHGFESKKASFRVSHQWGDGGTDHVPAHYLVQVQAGMSVTGLAEWHMVVTIGGEPPVIYRVKRDEELIDMMIASGAEFLRLVESGEPPPIDHSESWSSYLSERYPWSNDVYLAPTPEVDALAESLRDSQALWKQTGEDIERFKNQLRAFIGNASGVQTKFGKVSCKPRRSNPDSARIIAELAAKYGIPQAEIDRLSDECRHESYRPVIGYWRAR